MSGFEQSWSCKLWRALRRWYNSHCLSKEVCYNWAMFLFFGPGHHFTTHNITPLFPPKLSAEMGTQKSIRKNRWEAARGVSSQHDFILKPYKQPPNSTGRLFSCWVMLHLWMILLESTHFCFFLLSFEKLKQIPSVPVKCRTFWDVCLRSRLFHLL